MRSQTTAKTVSEYIAKAPKEVRAMLQQLREIIRSVAPDADERISYGMPYYEYKDRLVYFGIATHHIGLYISTPTLNEHKQDLEGYDFKNTTLRLPLDHKLPLTLIKKLIKARMKTNEERKKK